MCIEGGGRLLFSDAKLQELMADPRLELIHKQVLLQLYSMEAAGRLHEYREILPLYLSLEWPRCVEILAVLEDAGLVARNGNRIRMVHQIKSEDSPGSCGCTA